MPEEILAVGPVKASARSGGLLHRERGDQARAERRERASAAAAGFFSAAGAESARQPVWVRAVTLLMEAIEADYGTVMIVRGPQARRCRITRGRALENQPSRPWPTSATDPCPPPLAGVVIERLSPVPAALMATPPVPCATASFHALLYRPGTIQPLGCLSIHSVRALALAADGIALIDALAELLAQELAEAPLPDPTPA